MAGELPWSDFFDRGDDGNLRLRPSVPLGTGKTGFMYHLDREPAGTGPVGSTSVDTLYLDPENLQALFAGMGNSPRTKAAVISQLDRMGLKPGLDYRFPERPGGPGQGNRAYQSPAFLKIPNITPTVGPGEAVVNALVRGATNLATSGQSGSIRDALEANNVTRAAYGVGSGERVTDLAHELSIMGRGDLIDQTQETLLARAPVIERELPRGTVGGAMIGIPWFNRTFKGPDPEDPTYIADLEALNAAKENVLTQESFNRQVERERRAIEDLKSVFTNPPKPGAIDPAWHRGGEPRINVDYRFQDPDAIRMASWVMSLTPEQRAGITPEVLENKVRTLRNESRAKEIVRSFTNKAKTENFLKDFSGVSEANKTYGEDGSGYGDVWDKHGLAGLATLLGEQGLESAPSTVATMAATTIASLLTGGSSLAVMGAMGTSTTAMGMGSNFTSAFAAWAANQPPELKIEMSELSDPNSQSFKNLLTIAERDPVSFLQQMNAMTAEGDKRAIAEGVVAVGLNQLGDWGMDKLKAPLAKRGIIKDGSPLAAARGSFRRPGQLFRKDAAVWRKSLGPKLANAGIGTAWEAIEEGLTEVLTSVAVGEDVDMKAALSSFLVGGIMGGTSNVVFGKANIDDPMAAVRTQILNNEGGIDEVADQIARNTGLDPKRAKAALIRAKTMMDQFDELMAKQDPRRQKDPVFRKQMLDWYLQGARKVDKGKFLDNHKADQQQIAMADARRALTEMLAEQQVQELEAWDPANVTPDPRIKSIGDFLMMHNSNPAPGYDPARYK